MNNLYKSWIALALLGSPSIAASEANILLIEAARNQDLPSIQSLLKKGIDVNAVTPDGTSALLWASHWDNGEIADLLMQSGADVNQTNAYGIMPLWLACDNRSGEMVNSLLAYGADPNSTVSSSGESVLMNCAEAGADAAVAALLAAGADVEAREPDKGQNSLMWAAAEGHSEVVRLLIEHGADVSAATIPGIDTIPNRSCSVCKWEASPGGFTPLMFAVASGDLSTVRVLVEAGADVNQATPRHGSSLVIAGASGFEDIILFLLEKGADPNSADEAGLTALHHSVAKGLSYLNGVIYDPVYRIRPRNNHKLATSLLKAGANPDARTIRRQLLGPDGTPFDMAGATPFLLAATSADVEMMRLLIESGADTRINSNEGITPLMAATHMSCPGTCQFQDGEAGNVANKANIKLALQAVQFLIEKVSVDVNASGEDGRTAMHYAAFAGADEIVQYLYDHGSHIHIKADNGETAWTMASGISPNLGHRGRYGNHRSTVALLEKLGAVPGVVTDTGY